jgi:glycosyltransferase involved in cell wall biosynthesis
MSALPRSPLRLLYLTAEQWPTFRPDVIALFGKYLPRNGIFSDLVSERDLATTIEDAPAWTGGAALLCTVPHNRGAQYLLKLWHNLRVLASLDASKYDAIQVRDMSLSALAGLLVARMKGIQFFYWLSYPQSEGQIARANSRGIKAGMRFFFPLVQGLFGKWLMYRIILPRADHVFVQSRQMQIELARRGIPMARMTAVPMAVDTEIASSQRIVPVYDVRLAGKRVIVYLGTLDQNRQIDILLQMLVHIRISVPDILLLLVGDTNDAAHRECLKQEAQRLGVADLIVWTGWLDAELAWRYVSAAEVGLSPIPRGYLLDMGSPTKALEYMALNLPVVGNDNPDQAQVIAESGGGLCVRLEPRRFAEAVITLLHDEGLRQSMGAAGHRYVSAKRAYHKLAAQLAETYYGMLPGKSAEDKLT